MGKRLHIASKQYKLSNKEMAELLGKLGFKIKAHPFSAVSDEMLTALEKHFAGGAAKADEAKPQAKAKPTDTKTEKDKKPSQKSTEKNGVPSKPQSEKTRTGKKRSGAKPGQEDEEVEVNKQITIIKTAPPKKEIPTGKKKKGKNKRARFSKKVQAEMRDNERKTEAVLDRQGNKSQQQQQETSAETLPELTVPEDITVTQLAKYLDVPAVQLIKKLFGLGIVASLNQRLESEHIQLIGQEYGKEIVFAEDVIEIEEKPDKEEDLQIRPPVVTIMGHVDHGKTSLLDYIRKAHVADKEVGGITQHIGAYQVKTNDGIISFIDTPGHEAFTAMRAQGALVTDIAILVVAADDGVQPQTIEAIHHAQAADVPIIVAINKMDKADAKPDRIKQQLMPLHLVAEDWGGQTTMVEVSAISGKGLDELLEMIILQAEMMELKANPNRPAQGTIIEARLDKGMGPMATVLIRNGKIKKGDNIICGSSYGRVKALINDMGARVKEGGPSTPLAILGLNEVPKVGDKLSVAESAKFARYVGELRQKKAREERLSRDNRLKLADLFKQVTEGQAKDLNIIIKA
ncbi:MAG: translation initiation factor IF-2, partial [Candidatus Rifleibacteriota bacterium]